MHAINELVLATSNVGKINELSQLLAPISCQSQDHWGIGSADETGLSFVENAIIKARHASLIAKRPALADDSGLVVMALNGRPGIFSARFAHQNATDEENRDYLLSQLITTPQEQRQAYFFCALALCTHALDPTPLIATGVLHGSISLKPEGIFGFGYDPVFFLPQKKCTLAQLPDAEKNAISHRAEAINQLLQLIKNQPKNTPQQGESC